MYFKVELKHISNNITNNYGEVLERIQSIEKYLEDKPKFDEKAANMDINSYISDCPLPITNELDLNTLEDKTLGDQVFKNILVNMLCLNY